MERDEFGRRLHAAAEATRVFAAGFLVEPLSEAMRFRLRLNASYDGWGPGPEFVLYPQDSSLERAHQLADCDEATAVDALWRDGRIPQWINVTVIGLRESSTLLELLCCGRFTGNDQQLYHQRAGRPPFDIHGPALPVGYQPGDRFSVFHRSGCWTVEELSRVGAHAGLVWSLRLMGPELGDRPLLEFPAASSLEILELILSGVSGDLACLARHPRLRVLRITLPAATDFQLHLADLPALRYLTLSNLPSRPCGLPEIMSKLTGLKDLVLSGEGEIHVEGKLPEDFDRLSITGKRLVGALRLPARVRGTLARVGLHLSEVTEAELEMLLEPVEEVRAVDLEGCPVGDDLATRLASREGLRFLGLNKTQVTRPTLEKIAAEHPNLRLRPIMRKDPK